MQKTARLVALASLFLIPLFPLIVANSYFFPFITGKAFFFRILVELGFAAWLLLCLYDAKYRPKITPLFIGVTVLTFIALIADLAGVNPIRSLWSNFERMEGWMTIIHLWAFFVMASGIFGHGEEGKRNWTRWLMAEVGVAFVVSIYGLFQLGGAVDIHQGSTRIDSSLGNAAYMAVYMLLNAGFMAYLYVARKVKFSFRIRMNDLAVFWISAAVAVALAALFAGGSNHTYFWGALHTYAQAHTLLFVIDFALIILAIIYPMQILSFLFAFELYETATRGTILGLIGGVLLALVIYIVAGRKHVPKKRRYIAGGVIVGILAIIGIFMMERNTPFVQNHEVLQRLASISWSEAQGQARNYIWPMALKGFADRPILGWGQENFNYVFNINYVPQMWNQEQWFDRAHSVFLDWLVGTGLLGFLAYISLFILFLYAVWKSSHSIAEKSILTGLIAGYAIHNVFVFDNLASYVLFFAALALANSFTGHGEHVRVLGGTKHVHPDVLSYVAVPAVVVATVFAIWGLQIRPIQANRAIITALVDCYSNQPSVQTWKNALDVNTYVANQEAREQLLSCADRVILNQQVAGPTKQEFFSLATQAIQDQINATRYADARTFILGGAFYNVIQQYATATVLLEAATKLTPGKQSLDIELATDYVNTRHPEKAVALLEADYKVFTDNKAIKFDEKLKANLALAYIAAKRDTDALALYNNDATQFESVNFAEAYIISGQFQKAIAIYRKLYEADKGNVDNAVSLARLLFTTGDRAGAVSIFRQLQVAHPEFKDQIETAIKEAQAQ